MNSRNTQTQQPASAAGFTLVEVLIAMVLLGIGMLAVGAAQLASLRVSSQSQYRSQAMYLAEEQLEILQAMPLDNVLFDAAQTVQDPLNPIDLIPTDDDRTTFIREWTITPNIPQPGLATLEVQVTWNVDGDQREDNITTVTLDGIKETQ